jgi:DNA-directed RNA polymerase subunit RPC12/RpoP
LNKSPSEFWRRKTRGGNQLASRCKECSKKAAKEWTEKNPNYEKQRYAKSKKKTREKHLVRKYGVTLEIYDQILEEQNGKCAICSKKAKNESYGVLHVDHCHDTEKVRGLLCRNCNHVLGLMKDDPLTLKKAIAYLENPPAQIPELLGHAILSSIQQEEAHKAGQQSQGQCKQELEIGHVHTR